MAFYAFHNSILAGIYVPLTCNWVSEEKTLKHLTIFSAFLS